jgi:4-hydroxyphenylpyruvate dioxygenase
LQRVAFGVPDVPDAVAALRARGVGFVSVGAQQTYTRGALTQTYLGSLMFEIVHDERHEL